MFEFSNVYFIKCFNIFYTMQRLKYAISTFLVWMRLTVKLGLQLMLQIANIIFLHMLLYCIYIFE